ncbi:hypothetical protein [Sinorhizobium medicae]|uniref:hypothetical protein n=1 Tax=Sinorhizobium medicae TaxID=110321 RepID=UPI000FD80532|nr:hypothetical protein [Sinorhizobium medicae]MDX0438904.1 hypothetical protein [Sinorhizobium medicae]MDX0617555.1 hypothetical protein [Sinorhizobium medicae]MDX0654718.1 hypothetical protein [Sinorhizobium medicae]MDX1091044.1 hypothetical protein [Sinorhizobium medicae]MDX1115547.1 hypothetical protein [Sinorhizobium medicae]
MNEVTPTSFTWYELDVVNFEVGYKAAMNAIDERAQSTEERVRELFAIKPGEEFASTPDSQSEEAPFDFWAEVGDEERETDQAADVILRSFLIGLYQLFERHATNWVPSKKGENHLEKVNAFLTTKGFNPNMAAIGELKLVANALKHGAGESANRLFAERPDMFEVDQETDQSFEPSERNLAVTRLDFERYLRAVRQLGPRARRPWDAFPV